VGRMIVSWKTESDTTDGGEIGKVFVYDEDDPDVDPLDEWMTREAQRRSPARRATAS
jgi:hypothetical protein